VTDADIINATTLVDPLNERLKDISPTNFSLMITRIGKFQDQTAWVNLVIDAFVALDEDGPTPRLIATVKTKTPFPVRAPFRLFTSLDAQEGHSPDISISADIVDQQLKQRLKDKISDASSGGKVPSGTYSVKYTMTVVKLNDTPVTDIPEQNEFSVTVTNPTTATLLQPSDNGIEYPSPFPQFQWIYDTRAIELTVYEKRPEQQSLEDAISASDPFLQVEIDRKESGNLSIFTYPQAPVAGPGVRFIKGPRALERGKTYVVVLDGVRKALGYDIDPLRTIRLFRISDPQGQMVMNILQTALSGGTYQNTLNVIQDQKLQVNGSRITLNGVSITAQELQVILNQNKGNIKAIRFED
jgi:hypothetical protein